MTKVPLAFYPSIFSENEHRRAAGLPRAARAAESQHASAEPNRRPRKCSIDSSVQFSFQFSLKTSLCQLCNSLPSTTGSKHIELNTHKGYHALPQAQEYLPPVSSLPWCLCFRRQHTTYIHTLNQKTGKLNKHKFASCGATYYHFTFRLQKHATEDEIIQSQTQLVLLLHGSTSTCTSGVAGGHVALHCP